jgi:hypothetical protein
MMAEEDFKAITNPKKHKDENLSQSVAGKPPLS